MAVWHVEVYGDMAWKHDKVWKIELSLSYERYYFVFKGEELLSYGCDLSDRFYLKHLDKEVKGRVVEGERNSVKKIGSEFEIEVKDSDYTLALDYKPFGSSLTPSIHIETSEWGCLILPEVGKVYKGKDVWVEGMSGVLLVGKLIKSGMRWGTSVLRVYALTPTGECLFYEGNACDFRHFYSPKVFKVGNVMIIEVGKVDEGLKKCFFRTPELNYLFVYFFNKHRDERFARISFDLEHWIEVKAGTMIFKQENELYWKYWSIETDLALALSECFEETSEKRAQELYSVFTRKINSALKELKAYIGKQGWSSSLGLVQQLG